MTDYRFLALAARARVAAALIERPARDAAFYRVLATDARARVDAALLP